MRNQLDDFIITTSLDDPEWDAFVATTEGGHHVQTSLWAQVKAQLGWKPLRIILKHRCDIAAGCQMLIHHYPGLGNAGYVTKGPLCKLKDPELVKQIIERLFVLCKLYKIRIVIVQPPKNGEYIIPILAERNFHSSTLELAPTATILIDVSLSEGTLLSQLQKRTRKDIKHSKRAGVIIREGTKDDLHTFYNLHINTSVRQNFSPYPESYFDAMRRILEPHGYFQLLLAEIQGESISAGLLIPFRDTVITKIHGWSGKYREAGPNVALKWGSLLWAKNHGYHYVDLEGVNLEGARRLLKGEPLDEQLRNSPDFLKYGFGGQVVLYPEAYDHVSNPILRWAYRKASPKIGGQSVASKLMDRLRKR